MSHVHRAAMAATAAAILLSPTPAAAIPAFARRYDTSCQTCHTAFPQLTPFGEAFRRNGYRFPLGEDEERSVDEPVELGQDAHRSLFPAEVFPGEIPGALPLGVLITAQAMLARGAGGGGHAHDQPAPPAVEVGDGHTHADWGVGFGDAELALLLGGTLGDRISFFGKLAATSGGELTLERPHLVLGLLEPPLLMLRVGAFEPSLYGFSVHRALTGHALAFTTVGIGDNPWAPEPQQLGIELGGVLLHRLGWAAGVVEGAGGFDRDKDFYARLEWKLGGMSLDGATPTGFDRPWQELSVTVGGSFYRGVAPIEDPLGVAENELDTFWRASGDVSVQLRDLRLTLAYFHQSNEEPLFGIAGGGALDGFLAEASYVTWPWLIPVARYELFRQDLPGAEAEYGQRIGGGVVGLVRANISVRLLAQLRQDADDSLALEEVSLALSAGF